MHPAPRDLFGEVPVQLDELLAWMLAVPGIPPSSPRFVHYVRGYDVIGKIQRAKVAGTLEEDLAPGSSSSSPARLGAALAAADAARRKFARAHSLAVAAPRSPAAPRAG
jgi:hypothetical protein